MVVTQLLELFASAEQAILTGQSDDARFKDDMSFKGIMFSTFNGLNSFLTAPSIANLTEADRTAIGDGLNRLTNAIQGLEEVK